MSKLHKNTRLIHGKHAADPHRSITEPIYQTSVFAFDEIRENTDLFGSETTDYVYTRLGNPTVRALENTVADLEGGHQAVATASGMAAVNVVMFAFAGQNKHVLCADSVYGSTRAVMENDWKRFGVDVDFIDTSVQENIDAGIKDNTILVYIETPSNPRLKITDIRKAAQSAHKCGALLVADNTFAGPLYQNPLALGADIVLHSLTKYINGHSDVVGGIVTTAKQAHFEKIQHALIYSGGSMDPHQAFLVHRGLKTLSIRMEKAQKNAFAAAEFLEKHAQVKRVYYPGLPSHPGHEIAESQMSGYSSIIAFELSGGKPAGIKLINSLKLIIPAVSLGGIETLIQHPASMTHSNIKPEERLKSGITDGLIRMAVGTEHPDDLINDLAEALENS